MGKFIKKREEPIVCPNCKAEFEPEITEMIITFLDEFKYCPCCGKELFQNRGVLYGNKWIN